MLDRAVAAGGAWDPSLALRQGDLRLVGGDRPGAIVAWRSAAALPTLLERAAAAPADQAIDWYNLAQSVDPTDWRPYAGAAHLLESSDPNRSAALVSEALQLRGSDPARSTLARRMLNPNSPLAAGASIEPSPADADMFLLSSRLFLARGDLAAAVYAAQLSTRAAPTSPGTWQQLARLLDRLGRTAEAADARARTERLTQ
jgi:Flp pilus assembly protein TadD